MGSKKSKDSRDAVRLRFVELSHSDMFTDLQAPPKILYHYTDAAGLMGIIRDRCLRATHHRFLNDREEVTFGFRVAVDVLDALEKDLGAGLVASTRAQIEELLRGDSYLACSSTRHDTLSQWRAYASDGAGYCIGFSVRERITSASAQDKSTGVLRHWGSLLLECRYGPLKVEKALKNAFRQEVAFVRKQGCNIRDNDIIDMLAPQLASVAWRHAQLAKHEHFAEEREWRFVINSPDTHEEYCLGRRGLTPYRRTDVIDIQEIWIGPSAGPDPGVMSRTVTRFLERHDVTAAVAVWESPYVGR
ncbi:MAG: hypothetical protein RL033_4045 [Pseudomonadota bacterium]|jgi:hypothetical protein